ncbi:ferredoxin reductase family protein [Arthrobacter sp. C152]
MDTPTAATRPRTALLGVPVRWMGPGAIVFLFGLYGVFWFLERPAGEPLLGHLGQLFGGESILLFSIALVLISTLPHVEPVFGGIDHAAIWHRRAAITATVLLLPHIGFAANPAATSVGKTLAVIAATGLAALVVWAILPRWRTMLPAPARRWVVTVLRTRPLQLAGRLLGGYERWRGFHRLTGLFVAAGFLHGLLDASSFAAVPGLRWSYVVIGGTGLAFYAYRELLARHFLSHHDYQVAAVRPLTADLVEVTLRPLGKPLVFKPGQWAMIYLETADGWQRHPFSMSGAAHGDTIGITVKALGDHTTKLPDVVQTGMPAVVGGPYGRFDRHGGTADQVWIAAGVGITPFLSWLRSLHGELQENVDLFVTSAGPSPFAGEITAIARTQPHLKVHLVDTAVDGRLTPEQILASVGTEPRRLSVFMGGPDAMLRQFRKDFRAAGVRRANIHREYFQWR